MRPYRRVTSQLWCRVAPPTISKKDPVTGHLIKQQFGPWMRSAFGWMKKFKGLRGGSLDFFGKTEERQLERRLIEDYVKELDGICAALSPANHAAAVKLASVPDEIRGYGHVKEKSMADAQQLREQRGNDGRDGAEYFESDAPLTPRGGGDGDD